MQQWIYDYVHYHSRIHEVLGIARGTGKVQFGGRRGCTLALKADDAAILPAGTGHQSLSASKDFLVAGAYPLSDKYDDECTSSEDHERSLKTIPNVGRPRKDPILGAMVRCSKHGNPSGSIIAIDLCSRHPSVAVAAARHRSVGSVLPNSFPDFIQHQSRLAYQTREASI